jgi:aminoglycoside phosphotransferase (APT) family kinase protein
VPEVVPVKDDLAAWLTDEVGEPVAIEGLRRTSAGFSRENWLFVASWGGAAHDLILRRDPVGSVLETDREVEVEVLRAMERTDVPSPTLRWADVDGGRVGRPALVMDVAPGACDGFVLNGTRPPDERLGLAHSLYDLLAEIHLVDPGSFALDDPGPDAATHELDHWESVLRRVQLEPEPELTLVIDWLRAHAPRSARTTLVHGDFKPGNALLEGDRWTAVLDWETAHLGDPHEDLGWVTNPLRRGEHRIADAWEPSDLLERWSARTGWDVDPDALRWWQALANVKLSVIVLTGARAFSEGRLDRVHQAPVRIHGLLLDQIGL